MAKEGGTIFTFCVFIPKATFNLNQELLFKLFNNTQATPKTLKISRKNIKLCFNEWSCCGSYFGSPVKISMTGLRLKSPWRILCPVYSVHHWTTDFQRCRTSSTILVYNRSLQRILACQSLPNTGNRIFKDLNFKKFPGEHAPGPPTLYSCPDFQDFQHIRRQSFA